MRTWTQPRTFAAAGLLLLAAGFLWGAFRHEKPERLPPGWEPVNSRLAATVGDGEAGGKESDAADKRDANGAAPEAGAPDTAGQAGAQGSAPNRPGASFGPGASDGPGAAFGPGDDGGQDAPSGSAGFDINRATAAEWDELPGIGPAKAQAIVDDRERNGPFRSIDDLARVKGIGPKLLERLREAIEARNAPGGSP